LADYAALIRPTVRIAAIRSDLPVRLSGST